MLNFIEHSSDEVIHNSIRNRNLHGSNIIQFGTTRPLYVLSLKNCEIVSTIVICN